MLSLRDQCGLAVILEMILQVRTMRRQKYETLTAVVSSVSLESTSPR